MCAGMADRGAKCDIDFRAACAGGHNPRFSIMQFEAQSAGMGLVSKWGFWGGPSIEGEDSALFLQFMKTGLWRHGEASRRGFHMFEDRVDGLRPALIAIMKRQ